MSTFANGRPVCTGSDREPQPGSAYVDSALRTHGTCRGCDSEQRVRGDGLIEWHEPASA